MKGALPCRKALRENRAYAIVVAPFPGPQGADFRKVEIAHIIAPVVALALRKFLGDVADPIEMNIMYHHQFVVPGRDHILLEIVRAHAISERLGLQGMLRQIA